MWGEVIGACGLHVGSELGEFAVKETGSLEQDHPFVYTVYTDAWR